MSVDKYVSNDKTETSASSYMAKDINQLPSFRQWRNNVPQIYSQHVASFEINKNKKGTRFPNDHSKCILQCVQPGGNYWASRPPPSTSP